MCSFIHEIFCHIKSSCLFLFTLFGVSTFCSICCMFAISSHLELEKKIYDYNDLYNNTMYYKLGDNFIEEYDEHFNRDVSKYSKLSNLYNTLSTNEYFKYYVAYENPVELKNFDKNDLFLVNYESGNHSNSKVQITNNQGDTYTISSVKAIFLDDNTFELFNINLLNGRKFEDEEYEISDEDNNTLPVILGYDYNSIYNIGDYIEADTFTFNGQGVFLVVGILAKDTIINLESDNKLNLNRYMILPAKSSKNINLSESNKRQYEIYTYMTCNGIIASKLSADDVQNMIINICDQIKISPAFYIKGASNQRSYKLNISVHELNQSFSMVFLSGYFLIFLILISYTINFINRNTKYYAIISAFKYSLNTVIIMAAFEYTIILFFSFSISYIITTLSMKYMSMQFYNCSLIIVLLVYILMIVTIIIVYNYKIRKIDIAEYIRKY